MKRAETAVAALLVLGALVLLREALRLPVTWTAIGPGAGFFPFWLALGVAAFGSIVVVQSLLQRVGNSGEAFIPGRAWKPLLIVFLPMVAVVGVMDYLGIYLGGGLYLAGYMRLVGRHRWLSVALVSVLVPLVLFFIFERWFLLPLPKGTILEYFLYGR